MLDYKRLKHEHDHVWVRGYDKGFNQGSRRDILAPSCVASFALGLIIAAIFI